MLVVFFNPQGNFDADDSYLTEHPDFGGQLVYVKELCLALADMDVQVDIVTRRIDDPDWRGFSNTMDHYPGYPENPRILRIECGGRRFLNKEQLWPHLPEFVNNTLAYYGDRLPDFVTAHYADGGYCAVLFRQKTAIGFSFTGHSLGAQKLDKLGMTAGNAEEMEGQFHFAQRIAAERLSMCHAFNIVTSTRQERLEQYAHPLYQGAVDVHDDTKFSVIPPGVNTRIFSTHPAPEDEKIFQALADKLPQSRDPYIIASSRLDEKKNILGLVNAYVRSPALQDQARLGIFIRGIGDPFNDLGKLSKDERRVLEPILNIIAQTGNKHRVDFIDCRSQQELAGCYRFFARRNSVFALTAFYEPFGLAPIEAAACGLAVVATQNGGPSEILVGGSGVLVDPTNAEDIARGLLQGIAHAAAYARRGRRRVQMTYTWTKTAERYLEVITRGASQAQPWEGGDDTAYTALDASQQIQAFVRP